LTNEAPKYLPFTNQLFTESLQTESFEIGFVEILTPASFLPAYHPQMREVHLPLLAELNQKMQMLFKDIYLQFENGVKGLVNLQPHLPFSLRRQYAG